MNECFTWIRTSANTKLKIEKQETDICVVKSYEKPKGMLSASHVEKQTHTAVFFDQTIPNAVSY